MFRTKFNPAVHPMMYIECAKSGMSEVEIAAKIVVKDIPNHLEHSGLPESNGTKIIIVRPDASKSRVSI